jgi:hypothetical protein
LSGGSFRKLFACLLAVSAAALLAAAKAEAGYGIQPNGHSFEVTVGPTGAVAAPTTLDFVVYLDAQDSDAYVWISESSDISSSGTPVGASGGSCSQSSLIPFGEPGKWVCRASTSSLRPGRTYYWWLDFNRLEEGSALPQGRVSGPFPFTLVERPAAPAPPPDPHPPTVSTKTVAAAATLAAADRFTGGRSLKHRTLTQLIYRTMKQLGIPRTLAIACWNRADWLSVVQAEGEEPEHGSTMLLGFWKPMQPRWLHIAPGVCSDLQALLDTKIPTGRRAAALATVMHETLHAYGVVNEAQTNCYAVQLVPLLGFNMKMTDRRASYLGQLALRYVRSHAPSGYWHAGRCRDGGRWDLLPGLINLR